MENFTSETFTGATMGWALAEYSDEPRWRWWARWNDATRTGHANTWAQAIGDAKAAYEELEETQS